MCRYVPYMGENDDIVMDLSAYSKVYRGVVFQCLDNEMDEEVSALVATVCDAALLCVTVVCAVLYVTVV